MAWRGEVEDGMGWGGLVASKSEKREEARLAALERDAARYRWLRKNAGAWEVSRDCGEWTSCETGEKFKPRVFFTAFGTGYCGMRLDDAIDAAMQGANT